MNITEICKPLRVALKHSALAIAVALIASSGTARATHLSNIGAGGVAGVSGYYTSPGNAQYTAGTEGYTPHVSGSWSGFLDPWWIGMYFASNTRFTLKADAGYSVTLMDFQNLIYGGNPRPGYTVLDRNGNVLATIAQGVPNGASMSSFGWPTLTDTQLTIVFATDETDNAGIGNIKFSEQASALAVALTSPADTQGYPTGASITATATVAEPGAFTDTVTFHTTRIDPPGPTVNSVSTDTSSPFSADLGTLPAGTYEIHATVANDASPPGTATSATRTFTVAAAIPTTTMLATSANPSTYGQLTATASVSPTPTGGTVQFYDGVDPIGSPVTVNTSTGNAILNLNTLGAGTREIGATYSGHYLHAASTAPTLSQEVNTAQLTVRALNTFRAPNTANPDPFPTQITGYQNGQGFATSGVTGTPDLTTDAILSSPAGNYTITCVLGSLAAANYSFTFVDGTLTVAEVANTFSVNFYGYGALPTAEAKANVLVPADVPAGFGDWFTSGWKNIEVPWNPDTPQSPVTLTSNRGTSATFVLQTCRNGGPYLWDTPRTTLLGDGNGNLMDGHVNSTFQESEWFDMQVSAIPFAAYDVILYIGSNQAQFGDGTGKIVFNGGAERAFTLKSGAFDGTFTEMVDATTPGNYIVFKGVTGASFTTRTWGNGFNHVGPNGFQIREAAGYAGWAGANAPGQAPNQDYDNDGVQNGLEYFMGQTGLSFTAMPGLDGTNTVTWTMAPAYIGTYEVQTSPDLSTWTNVTPKPLPAGGHLSYTLPVGLGKQFVRLLVTPTP